MLYSNLKCTQCCHMLLHVHVGPYFTLCQQVKISSSFQQIRERQAYDIYFQSKIHLLECKINSEAKKW